MRALRADCYVIRNKPEKNAYVPTPAVLSYFASGRESESESESESVQRRVGSPSRIGVEVGSRNSTATTPKPCFPCTKSKHRHTPRNATYVPTTHPSPRQSARLFVDVLVWHHLASERGAAHQTHQVNPTVRRALAGRNH